MGTPDFFLGTAVAAMLAMLAWGDRISQPTESLRDLERSLLRKLRLTKKGGLPLMREPGDFLEQMASVIDLYGNPNLEREDLDQIEGLRELQTQMRDLKSKCLRRYIILLWLCIYCFVAGAGSALFGAAFLPQPIQVSLIGMSTWDGIFWFIFSVFAVLVIQNLFSTNTAEQEVTSLLGQIRDRVEE